jgi:subtilisin family serine protease
MKEKYLILRGERATTADPFLGPLASPAFRGASDGLAIEVDDVEIEDRTSIRDLSHDAGVIALAPVMPMTLIAPVEVQDAPESVAEVAWGVKAVKADSSPFSGQGVVVAVLDTGIDASHPAFSGVEIVQRDFTGDGDGDPDGHGTHCAGTIFGRTADGTRIGVATGVQKALIGKVLGRRGGSSDQIARAISWAVGNGAHVISMSLGIDFPGFQRRLLEQGWPPELATSRALEGYRANVQLFERLASTLRSTASFLQPALVIAAAGNESRRHVNPDFEVAVSPPAVSEGVISVGALGQGNAGLTVAGFSNTGVDVSGPGVGILSAKSGGGLSTASGTSMAAPHVAGVAALWAEKIRDTGVLSVLQWGARLIGTAAKRDLEAGFNPFRVGAGLVQAPQG